MIQEIDERLIELFVENRVISHKETTLYRSGITGSDFFDIDRILGKPEPQKLLINRIEHHIQKFVDDGLEYDTIALIHKDIGPIGLVAYASQISEHLDKNVVIVKNWKNLRSNKLKLKGYDVSKSESILLIDDVVTTGSTQKNAIDAINSNNGTVSGFLSVFTRDPDRVGDLKSIYDLDFVKSLFTHHDLISLGLAFPEEFEMYMERNFIDDYPDINKMGGGDGKDQIDRALEDKVTELLENNDKSMTPENKQVLKNLYFNILTHVYQEDLYVDKDPKSMN
ncbi:hypothetical protein ACFQE1_03350 [Halobium palmae]|uniref:Orotate phosphoribosyltransferase n=1 Tax=Halobium palmae TaxID=1776492 RepID=A0ABD5RVP4_9EURY